MIQLFYHIQENRDGTFTYHDFKSGCSGGYAFVWGDHYEHFNTLGEAENYAKSRGGINAYGY
jgi:hypothetical protein